MADQAINALSTKTAPETSDQLLLVGAGEPQLIDYDKLADAILNKITSKNYALDAGTMTLPAALNALNGNMGVKIARYYTNNGTITIKTNWKGAEYARATIAVISSSGGIIVAELSKSGIISTNSTDSTVKINFSDKVLTFSNLPWYSTPFFMFDSKIIDLL